MATLYEYFNTGDDGFVDAYGIYWLAQTFTPVTAHKITSVKLKLYRLGSPGIVTVSIKATDESGHPTDADLCSGTTDGDTLAESFPYEWREITLGSGYNLSASIRYAIAIRAPSGDLTNYVIWRRDKSEPTYTEGNREDSYDDGLTWTAITTSDFMFEDWGEPLVTEKQSSDSGSGVDVLVALEKWSANWLLGWAKRVKLTIDQTDIDAALSNFPILVYLSALSGRNGDDATCVFDELTQDANRKKIAVTTSDGETQCYVEIEKWDDANEQAWLWVKVPAIASDADTDLYLYYDSTHTENTDYVGDPSDAVVHNVWDSNFILVSHMRDDPDNQHIGDSTVNANDGTKDAAGAPAVTTSGKIGEAQDFDGGDDKIVIADNATLRGMATLTVEGWIWIDAADASYDGMIDKTAGSTNRCYNVGLRAGKLEWGVVNADNTKVTLNDTDKAATGEWIHVVGLYDGVKIYIYKNNVSVGTPLNQSGDVKSDTVALHLGCYGGGATFFFDGRIDEVRVSNTARPAAWIKATYETGIDHLLDFGEEETAGITEKQSSDVGAGVDALAEILVLLTKTETGSGIEALGARALGLFDSGDGIDISSLLGILTKSDIGSGADTLAALLAALIKTEAGSDIEAIGSRDLSQAETGIGAESKIQTAILQKSDKGYCGQVLEG